MTYKYTIVSQPMNYKIEKEFYNALNFIQIPEDIIFKTTCNKFVRNK